MNRTRVRPVTTSVSQVLVLYGVLLFFLSACAESSTVQDGENPAVDGDWDAEQEATDGDVTPADGDEEESDVPDGDQEREEQEAEDESPMPDGDETEADPELPCDDPNTYYRDQDRDGYGDPASPLLLCQAETGYVEDNTDCHDDNPTAFPGSHAQEIPRDGIDQDCDGLDACTDLNCDGWPDLVFAQTDEDGNYFTNSYVYLGGEGRFAEAVRWTIPTIGAMGVVSADFDKDGYPDLAFASVREGADSAEQAHTTSLVYYGTGNGVRVDERIELPTTGCADVTAADVDRDGWIDLIFSNRFAGKPGSMPDPADYHINSVVYLNGPQGFDASHKFELPTVGAARSAVADLNDDGFQDIVFANGVMQLIGTDSYIYWGGAQGWSESARTSLKTQFPEGLLIADITGDEKPDLLFTSWLCTLCQGTYVYENTDSGFAEEHRRVIDGANGGTDAKFRDLNNDGHGDLILANGAFGASTSYVYWGPDLAEATRTELPVSTASEVAVADLDLDGHLDLVFASHPVSLKSEETSVIFWGGGPNGYSAALSTNLTTVHAAGLKAIAR